MENNKNDSLNNNRPYSSDPIYSYQPLWGSWTIDSQIGEGSYGKVYKALRIEFGYTYTSAVKIITIPSKEQLRQALSSFGDDTSSLKTYFSEMVSNIVKEINILYRLKSCPNIVSYEDHTVIEKKDDLGWDILIRMEYLNPLPEYLQKNRLPIEDIITLALDILNAISVCSKSNIIHRDIKDENIFVSEHKIFKLGDFGIAKELSKSGKASSFKGTPMYMSPEVFRAQKYDIRSDLYSLGLLLYKLTNKGRIPFMPDYPESFKYSDTEAAIDKRLSGAAMPIPSYSGNDLGAIILKACAFKPENRYQSPKDMSDDLKKLLPRLDKSFLNKDVTHLGPKHDETTPLYQFDAKEPVKDKTNYSKDKLKGNRDIKKLLLIGLLVALAIIIGAGSYFMYLFFKTSVPETETAGVSTTIKSQTTETSGKAQSETTESSLSSVTTAETTIVERTPETVNTGDGNYKILFNSDFDGDSDIYSMNIDGTELINLTNNDIEDWGPSYSFVTSKVVYSCRTVKGDKTSEQVFIMDIDGRNKRQIIKNGGGPCISADGSKIVFMSYYGGNSEIDLINTDGSNQTRLTNNSAFDGWPKFSPDGNKIVFSSERTGDMEIYTMDLTGNNTNRLTDIIAWDDFPCFSSDGTKIIFFSERAGGPGIFIMNVDGSNPNRLTSDIYVGYYPSISLDGKKITYTRGNSANQSNISNQGDIYIMNSNGSNQTIVPFNNQKGGWSVFIKN